jgi:transposase
LFYYFRLEDQIPPDHLLRLVDRFVDFSFLRKQLKDFHSPMGRPSIDPEILLRLLLVGYLYGITSERRLMDEARMHLAYRWFTRLAFDQEIPDHSIFSKNRHGRFRQSSVFRKVFEKIVQCCLEEGLVEGRSLAVDESLVGANASQQSRVPRGSVSVCSCEASEDLRTDARCPEKLWRNLGAKRHLMAFFERFRLGKTAETTGFWRKRAGIEPSAERKPRAHSTN